METKSLKEKVSKMLKKLLDISLYALGIVVAFIIGFYCNQLTDYYKTRYSKLPDPHPIEYISVAITDRNELLIIDKSNQTIDIYPDSIGLMIFKSYANNITQNVK